MSYLISNFRTLTMNYPTDSCQLWKNCKKRKSDEYGLLLMTMSDEQGVPSPPHNVHDDNMNGEWECSNAGLGQITAHNARWI
jgi:hypothetical protein